jgi:biotin carboxyl carrier protein
MELNFNDITLDISSNGKTFTLTSTDKTIQAEVLHAEGGKFVLLIDGNHITAYVSSDNAERWVTVSGRTFKLTKLAGARQGGHTHHAAGALRVTAPMPGQVRAVNVSEGDAVTKGQTLLVLEAMKMEIRIQAPSDGKVMKLFVKQGQMVDREQMLIETE